MLTTIKAGCVDCLPSRGEQVKVYLATIFLMQYILIISFGVLDIQSSSESILH